MAMLTTSFFFFSSFFLLLLSFTSLSSSSSSAINTDAQQLINFKLALPDPSVLKNWEQNQNPCSFNGVKCNETRVSSIDLTSLHLNTNFHLVASQLLTLENLQTLSLQNTNLSGNISLPPGSKCSSYLTSIDLSHNSLSGPLFVLSNLGSCSSLKSLNLSSNLLAFSGKESGGLKLSLESLDLSYNNQISGPNVVPWIVYNGCKDFKVAIFEG
ncbi:hypothetical protein Patl1_27641 [Pistacia atlantica]|uniref:Uncharacterized protein n=1 Tax=Pistacia atlantica TaxID=434234 RepID=A0ACC1BFQ7_9ROSI|nr:hypothetical protein Patl1_27641 [Pistacia atlantica]